jgi:hypothetical protein
MQCLVAVAVFGAFVCSADAGSVLNVRDFGAKGDGFTDDSLSIQAAIQASPEGGTVSIPAGTFVIGLAGQARQSGLVGTVGNYPDKTLIHSSLIIGKKSLHLVGAGAATILQIQAHAKARAISVTPTATNVLIANLVIDGNKTQRQTQDAWPNGFVVDALILGWFAKGLIVSGVETRNGIEDGIGCWQCDSVTYASMHSFNNGTKFAGGTGASYSGKNGIIRDSVFENNNGAGLWSAYGTEKVAIQNNIFRGNTGAAIDAGGQNASDNDSDYSITGNTLIGNGTGGYAAIEIRGITKGLISGNTISDNIAGIRLQDAVGNHTSRAWTISNNVIGNSQVKHIQSKGIWIAGVSSSVQISGNKCSNNGNSVSDQIYIEPKALVNPDYLSVNSLVFQ